MLTIGQTDINKRYLPWILDDRSHSVCYRRFGAPLSASVMVSRRPTSITLGHMIACRLFLKVMIRETEADNRSSSTRVRDLAGRHCIHQRRV